MKRFVLLVATCLLILYHNNIKLFGRRLIAHQEYIQQRCCVNLSLWGYATPLKSEFTCSAPQQVFSSKCLTRGYHPSFPHREAYKSFCAAEQVQDPQNNRQ